MNRSLQRVLKVRTLFEQVSRAGVEKQAGWLARVEAAVDVEGRIEQASYNGWRRSLLTDGTENGHERAMARISGEMARSKRAKLEPVRERAAQQMDMARELWLTTRRERRQVEAVLEAQAKDERLEDDRRRQRDLDDWFNLRHAQRTARRRRERTLRTS